MSILLLGSGGGISRGTNAWSGQHVVAVAADVNMIMMTGGSCAPGTG